MAALPRTYETIWFDTDMYLPVYWRGRIHLFEHPVVEVVHDIVQDRHYLVITDMASETESARCFPLVNLAHDFSQLTGIAVPDELREVA